MKRLLHILFAFSVAVASCQCAAAAEHDMGHDMAPMSLEAAQECHDADAPALEPTDCCDINAVNAKASTDKAGSMLATIGGSAYIMHVPSPEGISAAIERRRGPPPPTTPISRCDCLLA